MAVMMRWPAVCHTISQQYGVKNSRYAKGYHTGLDIACIAGSPIRAAHDGRVVFSGWKDSYGNTVEIEANSNLLTSYHHMVRTPSVREGQTVSAGTVIGYIGSTGMSTGPHLHFEVRVNGTDVDPNPYLDGTTSVDTAGYEQAGFGDIFSFPGKILDVFSWLTKTSNWYRVGLVLGGVALIMLALRGTVMGTVMQKYGGKAIQSVKGKANSNAQS